MVLVELVVLVVLVVCCLGALPLVDWCVLGVGVRVCVLHGG